MKLALAFVCLGLIWVGLMDLEPFRPSRAGGARALRARTVRQGRRVSRRQRLS